MNAVLVANGGPVSLLCSRCPNFLNTTWAKIGIGFVLNLGKPSCLNSKPHRKWSVVGEFDGLLPAALASAQGQR